MNTYITLACLLAIFGLSQGSAIGAIGGYGIGVPWVGHLGPAISTANLVKAAPIPVIRTHVAPVVTAPVLRTVPVGWGGWNGLGWNGLGWNGHGWNGNGWNGLGWGGVGGWGNWGGWGGWGKH